MHVDFHRFFLFDKNRRGETANPPPTVSVRVSFLIPLQDQIAYCQWQL